MTRVLVTLLLALSLAPVAPVLARRTGITLINNAISSGGANGSTTGAIDTRGSNFCVAVAFHYDIGAIAVTDSVNGSSGWTPLTDTAGGFAGNTQIWYNANLSSGNVGAAQTFTVSGSGVYAVIGAACFSGVAASPFDVENHAAQTSGTTLQPGSITPGFNNELVIAASGWNAADTSSISGGGFSTILQHQDYGGGNNMGGSMAYLVQSTATATNPTFTGSTGFLTSAAIASFKESTGGGSAFPPGIVNFPIRCCKGVR